MACSPRIIFEPPWRYRRQSAGDASTAWRLELGVTVRIWSANLLFTATRVGALLQLLDRARPDLILLQELTPGVARRLAAELDASHPHRRLEPEVGPDGFGMISRFPLGPAHTHTLPGGTRHLQAARMEGPLGPVALFNVHLVSPVDARAIAAWGAWRVGRLREAQAADVAREVARAGSPAVIAGDLNCWPGRPAARVLAHTGTDAWAAAGRGFGPTWPRRWPWFPIRAVPLLRLDYCFVTPPLRAEQARVVRAPFGSDHCALVVDVAADGEA
jgi:endonuclease/exonuclease/phosphatase family metal-dependent hydrolase